MERTWENVKCPLCRETFSIDERHVSGSNLRAIMALVRGDAAARQLVADYPIECPRCQKHIPFEPRSEYRRRKLAALNARIYELGALVEKDEDGPGELYALTAGALDALSKSLSSDFPLDSVRGFVRKIQDLLADEIRKSGAVAGHPVAVLLKDVLAIASADVGEYRNLPEAPRDEADEKREALFKAFDALKEPPPEAPDAPPPAKKGCFIATAACGTAQAPDVVALSTFRDEVLRRSMTGRFVIDSYERLSPPIAAVIARSRAARWLVRRAIVAPARRAADWWRRAR